MAQITICQDVSLTCINIAYASFTVWIISLLKHLFKVGSVAQNYTKDQIVAKRNHAKTWIIESSNLEHRFLSKCVHRIN